MNTSPRPQLGARANMMSKQARKRANKKKGWYGVPAAEPAAVDESEPEPEPAPSSIRPVLKDTPPEPTEKVADVEKDEAELSAEILGSGTTRDTHPGTFPGLGDVDSNSPSTGDWHTPAARVRSEDDVRGGQPKTAMSSNATWEEVTQFALNCSILSGTFEDIVIVAYSQRSPSGVCTPQSLHANTALVQRALKDAQLRAYIYATIVRLANADLDAVHSAWE